MGTMKRLLAALASAATLLAGAPLELAAQEKAPIRMLIPSGPGSTLDIIGRLVGERLSQQSGRPVIVDNKAGASGIIAYDMVAKSPPDGLTITAVQAGFVSNRFLFKATNYDVFKDFAPIAMVARSPMILVARSEFPASDIASLRSLSKSRPESLTYGSLNGANQMNVELVRKLLDIEMRNVPYRAAGQALTDMLAGAIDTQLLVYGTAAPLLRSGKLKAFVVLSKDRLGALPQVPSATDIGLGGEVLSWAGFVAAAGTPEPIASQLHATINQVAQEPAVRERMIEMGFEPFVMGRPDMITYMQRETQVYERVSKELGIRPE